MKKILPISLIAILILVWGVRFYLLNQDIDTPIVQIFQRGTEVPVEKDFFIDSDEEMDGYTVTVLDAELVSVEDFLQRYDAEEERENIGNLQIISIQSGFLLATKIILLLTRRVFLWKHII